MDSNRASYQYAPLQTQTIAMVCLGINCASKNTQFSCDNIIHPTRDSENAGDVATI